ncbi:CutA1 divalent ion tolerance protein-domain-containing protein [Melampsora americana]|nr:CutA1 divalent ion tolerance protein-domain-containing protein [Melampsora americana]
MSPWNKSWPALSSQFRSFRSLRMSIRPASNVSNEFKMMLCTAPKANVDQLATGLVEQKLCACVNVLNSVSSVYRWDGKVTKDEEALMLIKTTQSKCQELIAWIHAHHPYETPEVVSLNVGQFSSLSFFALQPMWLECDISLVTA